ncbi:MAG TPA: hypothetical protein VGG19_20795 [Tepidisphaeraceae bacterium]
MSILILVTLLIANIFGPIYYLVAIVLCLLSLWARCYFEAFVSLFGPASLAVLSATVAYFLGTAKFQYMGLPNVEFFNIDPTYRCGRATGGCLGSGNEWLTELPYNLTIMSLVTVFGPERGSYTGPYPTQADDAAALAHGFPVNLNDFSHDHFKVGGASVKLDEGVGKRIVNWWMVFSGSLSDYAPGGFFADQPMPMATGAIWKDRVLILKGPPGNPTIAIIDLKSGRPFAFYGGFGRSHPANWRKSDDL